MSVTFIIKLFNHFCNHSTRYLFFLLIAYLIFGLWPFNFTARNEARLSPEGGLNIARPGSAYTASPSEKLHNLNHFTIYIDLTTSSNGMSSFERIFSYAINHKDMNFIVGQWKDGCSFHLPDEKNQRVIHFGADDLLKKEERVGLVIGYDGMKLSMYQDGKVRKFRDTGPLSFTGWSQEYPLVIGSDADGKAQWRGTIYEASIYDRSLSPAEVARLSDPNGRKGTRDENPPVSPFAKGGESDGKPLIHYVFRPENTYEREFRGKRALGVRDLGKGDPADLVIPEYFEPYERVFLGLEDNWMQYKSNWLDVAVNILGFVPFGILLFLELVNGKLGIGRRGFGLRDQYKAALVVILVVVVGFVVSFAIEYLQAYLPSRDSSMRDLVTNVLGTFIGALAAVWLVKCRFAATTVDKLIG